MPTFPAMQVGAAHAAEAHFYDDFTRPRDRIRNIRQPDVTRARTLLKWEPKVTLEDGLVKTIDYFRTKVK